MKQRENFPFEAIHVIAKVLEDNSDKYGPGDWRRIDIREHIAHAIEHVWQHQLGDISENHLDHALCRLAMVVALRERP